MAFVVEDGTSVAGSNSYVTVAFADDYFAIDSTVSVTWAAYLTAEKERLLQLASRILDQKVKWKGKRFVETSSMRWPRTGVYDRDNILVDDDEIPLQLQECVCEMVKYLIAGNDPTTGQGVEWIKKIVADVVEVEYQDGAGQTSLPAIFSQLLRGIGTYPSALGNTFARIIKA